MRSLRHLEAVVGGCGAAASYITASSASASVDGAMDTVDTVDGRGGLNVVDSSSTSSSLPMVFPN